MISELKTKAKESLKGKWGPTIAVFLIYGILSGIGSSLSTKYEVVDGQLTNVASPTLSVIGSVISIVVTCLLALGYYSYFLKISRNEKPGIDELFSKVGMFFRCLAATVLIGLIVFAGCLVLIVPGIILSLCYSMTYYIMLDDEKISPVEAMKKSREMMRGHKGELFALLLSFIGWALLSVLTCFILLIWLVPYINTTQANFYNKIKGE